jgi:hypothetical protein
MTVLVLPEPGLISGVLTGLQGVWMTQNLEFDKFVYTVSKRS